MYYIVEQLYAKFPEVRFHRTITIFEIIPVDMYLNQAVVDELLVHPDDLINPEYPIRLLAVSHEPYRFIATSENERLFVAWSLGLMIVEFRIDPKSELYYQKYFDEIHMVMGMSHQNFHQAGIRSWADLQSNIIPPDEYLLKTEESVIAMRLLNKKDEQ